MPLFLLAVVSSIVKPLRKSIQLGSSNKAVTFKLHNFLLDLLRRNFDLKASTLRLFPIICFPIPIDRSNDLLANTSSDSVNCRIYIVSNMIKDD